MKRLHYAGGSAVVSDALARVLVDYLVALATAGRVAAASFPSEGTDGQVVQVEVVLGPTSELMVMECGEAGGGAPGEDAIFVERIRLAIANLNDAATHRFAEQIPAEQIGWGSDFDWL